MSKLLGSVRSWFGRVVAWLVGPPRGLPTWEVYTDANGDSRWRLLAGNGETVAQGEQHRDAHDALRAAETVDRIVRQARRHVTGVPGRTRL